MNKRLLHIIVPILFSVCKVHAQAEEPGVVTVDTTYVVAETSSEVVFDEADPTATQLSTRKADPTVVDQLRKDKDLSYSRKQPLKKKEKEMSTTKPWSAKPWVKDLLWAIIILAFIAIVIAFLYRSNAGLFRKKVSDTDAPPNEGEMPENIFDIQYENEIRKAVAAGKYHLGIRLLYLQTLRDLTAAGFIEFRQEKTNGDYVFQLFNSPFYKSFFSLTRNYEYVWYGKFPVSANAFEIMQAEFLEFKRRIPI